MCKKLTFYNSKKITIASKYFVIRLSQVFHDLSFFQQLELILLHQQRKVVDFLGSLIVYFFLSIVNKKLPQQVRRN